MAATETPLDLSAVKPERQISFAPDIITREQSKEEGNAENQKPTVNTNYEQWQRKQPEQSSITIRRKPGKDKIVVRRFVKEQPNVLLDKYGAKYGRPETACSSQCQHPWLPRTKLRAEEIKAQKEAGELNLLRAQIKIQQKHLYEINERRDNLLNENMREMQEIATLEDSVHKDVHSLIQKYGKFRGAAESAQKIFEKQKQELIAAVEKTKLEVEEKSRVLYKDVHEMDNKLMEAKEKYKILLTYKEDAYFKNTAKIHALEKELLEADDKHEKQKSDVTKLIEVEREKMIMNRKEFEQLLVADIAQEYVDEVHFSWKQMADENKSMQANMEKIGKESDKMEKDIQNLEEEIKLMLERPSTSVKATMFPEIFKKRPKCQPDDDVILDIPTQKKNILV